MKYLIIGSDATVPCVKNENGLYPRLFVHLDYAIKEDLEEVTVLDEEGFFNMRWERFQGKLVTLNQTYYNISLDEFKQCLMGEAEAILTDEKTRAPK